MPVPVAVTPSHIQLPDARNFDETWNYISAGLDLILHAPRGGMTKARYIGLHT